MSVVWKLIRRLTYVCGKLHAQCYNLKPGIKVQWGTLIEPGVVISTQGGGTITIGKDCYLYRGAQLYSMGGAVLMGNNCSLNPYSVLYGSGVLTIGNGVRIAASSTIVAANHIFSDRNRFIYKQGLDKQGINIEDDVWIASGVRVLDGVTIKRGCVIGANSVVTKNTEEYGIYVGVPAKLIKHC